jgi:Lhr-like helicase
MGLKMLDQVSHEIDASASCLVFTNTRAQAELWYQALLEARPDWAGLIACTMPHWPGKPATGSSAASSRAA